MKISILQGRLIDPASGLDTIDDLHIADGRILAIGPAPEGFVAEQSIDARGLVVMPGIIDLRAHLREPGQKQKGSIASETRAAAAGGITTLCCAPSTRPVIDSAPIAEQIIRRAEQAGRARVLPIGALTPGLTGEQISKMNALHRAGCIAVGNDQVPMRNTLVVRRAMEYAASLGIPVMLFSQDAWLSESGHMHEGAVSTRLGIPGIPSCAEVIGVGRDLNLIEQTGVRAHFCQLSSARAVEMIAEAQARGLPVTADVTAHHLFLTEQDVDPFNSLCHVMPPLRSQRDRDGLRAALGDGVIQAICSDHQPHDKDAKLAPFTATEPGISALETLLPLSLRLVEEGVLDLHDALGRLTWQPARILGLESGELATGRVADLCLFDPEAYWTVSEDRLFSQGKNTPFLGWELKGAVRYTLLDGQLVHQAND